MRFKPLGNRILVKRSKAVASKGGILLPESAQEKPKEGEVIAVGPGKEQPLECKVGDRVLFSSYAGSEVDEQHLILSEEEILCIIT